jgi:hypothetical protein
VAGHGYGSRTLGPVCINCKPSQSTNNQWIRRLANTVPQFKKLWGRGSQSSCQTLLSMRSLPRLVSGVPYGTARISCRWVSRTGAFPPSTQECRWVGQNPRSMTASYLTTTWILITPSGLLRGYGDRIRWPRPPAWDLDGPSGPGIRMLVIRRLRRLAWDLDGLRALHSVACHSAAEATGMGSCRPIRALRSVACDSVADDTGLLSGSRLAVADSTMG